VSTVTLLLERLRRNRPRQGAPGAPDIERVLALVGRAGLGGRVARLEPLGVAKG
jgi:hypothetical protein